MDKDIRINEQLNVLGICMQRYNFNISSLVREIIAKYLNISCELQYETYTIPSCKFCEKINCSYCTYECITDEYCHKCSFQIRFGLGRRHIKPFIKDIHRSTSNLDFEDMNLVNYVSIYDKRNNNNNPDFQEYWYDPPLKYTIYIEHFKNDYVYKKFYVHIIQCGNPNSCYKFYLIWNTIEDTCIFYNIYGIPIWNIYDIKEYMVSGLSEKKYRDYHSTVLSFTEILDLLFIKTPKISEFNQHINSIEVHYTNIPELVSHYQQSKNNPYNLDPNYMAHRRFAIIQNQKKQHYQNGKKYHQSNTSNDNIPIVESDSTETEWTVVKSRKKRNQSS
jgi:hypothetical protein